VHAEPPVVNITPTPAPAVTVPPANYNIYITIEGLGTTETTGVMQSGSDTHVSVQTPVQIARPVTPALSGKTYRLQVGSFAESAHAQEAYNKIVRAGLTPALERYEGKIRVVVPSVSAQDVNGYKTKLQNAGFADIWVREE
jgi:cell division protein FtsN